jgi:hypothetical protein
VKQTGKDSIKKQDSQSKKVKLRVFFVNTFSWSTSINYDLNDYNMVSKEVFE